MSWKRVSLLSFGLACPWLGASAPAQVDSQRIEELNRLLNQIEKALQSSISPASVERRLKERTPRYRKFRIAEATPTTKDAPATEKTPASRPEPKGRLLGDAEKARLPAGTVVVVDGMPVLQEEVDGLAKYLATYESGTREDHLVRAVNEIVTIKSVQAAFKKELPQIEKRIRDLHAQAVAAGADFGKVARQNSDCPSKDADGDLGLFGRSQMVPSFARWAFSLPVGKISPVFATQFGYHFLKVTGKQKGKTPAESMAKASHVLVMYTQDQARLQEISMRVLRGASDIAVVSTDWRDRLPPAYR